MSKDQIIQLLLAYIRELGMPYRFKAFLRERGLKPSDIGMSDE